MADKIVQLIDSQNDNIFPLSSDPNAAHITMTTADPGEGSPLDQNEFIGVYGGDPIIMDYSTNEINTGAKWIDGRPIYKKTIVSTLSGSENSVNTGVQNIDLLIDWHNTVVTSSTRQMVVGYRASGPATSTYNTNYIMQAVQFNKDDNQLKFEFGTNYTGSKTVYSTIWYTKSQ